MSILTTRARRTWSTGPRRSAACPIPPASATRSTLDGAGWLLLLQLLWARLRIGIISVATTIISIIPTRLLHIQPRILKLHTSIPKPQTLPRKHACCLRQGSQAHDPMPAQCGPAGCMGGGLGSGLGFGFRVYDPGFGI